MDEGITRIHAAEPAERSRSTTKTPSHRQLLGFLKALWREMQDDYVLDGAAVLAFFFLLAAFPAALFLLSLLPSLSIPHLQQAILDLLHQVLPREAANLFDITVRRVAAEGRHGVFTFGLVIALWSGSAGVAAIMDQLNVVNDVKETRPFWKARGLAILLMLFYVVLAIVSLSLVIFGGVVQSWLASQIGWSPALRLFFAILRWIIIAAAALLALAVAYRFCPDANLRFRYLSPGNVLVTLLVALASIGLRFYVSTFGNYSATYGSLAAVVILMLWMYIVGIVLLLGAEVDKILQAHKSKQPESS